MKRPDGGVVVLLANESSTSQVTAPVMSAASDRSAVKVAGCVDPASGTPETVNVGVPAALAGSGIPTNSAANSATIRSPANRRAGEKSAIEGATT